MLQDDEREQSARSNFTTDTQSVVTSLLSVEAPPRRRSAQIDSPHSSSPSSPSRFFYCSMGLLGSRLRFAVTCLIAVSKSSFLSGLEQ